MSAPTSVPTDAGAGLGLSLGGLWQASFRAMASPIRVQFGLDCRQPQDAFARVRELFAVVERQCTRFDESSDLMRANRAQDGWTPVGAYCFAALQAAYDAHLLTDGLFEPRVLATLAALGYSASWTAGAPAEGQVGQVEAVAPPRGPWQPGFDEHRQAVRIGPDPVDLGGIGKGLTLRWADELARAAGCPSFLIDAGGDLVARGAGPDGDGWHIGVEDPDGGAAPVAVLRVRDAACATSSTRLRRWRAGGEDVHHLIDPRSGRSGGGALRAVTVIADDPAEAEVWSKTLFLHGDRIGAVAQRENLAALWVGAGNVLDWSPAMQPSLLWWPA